MNEFPQTPSNEYAPTEGADERPDSATPVSEDAPVSETPDGETLEEPAGGADQAVDEAVAIDADVSAADEPVYEPDIEDEVATPSAEESAIHIDDRSAEEEAEEVAIDASERAGEELEAEPEVSRAIEEEVEALGPAEERPPEELEAAATAPIEAPSEEIAPPAAATPEGNGSAPAEAEVVEVPDVEAGPDPFRGPGDWYVVHTYAGYENKVKTNLESRIHTMQMEDKIFDVHIPMEDVMEIKGGKKQVVQRKVFPGYLLVKMTYDNDSWYVVRNTPGVTGFVAAGTGSKPTPLSRREVEKILAVKKEEVKPTFRLGFEEGDVVRIISGPFADFNGTISEINVDQSKLKVLVNIFDRETPVELSFDQVAKV